jgi:hypothetical protein
MDRQRVAGMRRRQSGAGSALVLAISRPAHEGGSVNVTPSATGRTDNAQGKSLGLKALRAGRLQDPLLNGPVKTTPIPIYY